jgi:hypothetical protein
MARLALGIAAGIIITTIAGAAAGSHAQDDGDHLDKPVLEARPETDWIDDVVECLAWAESRNTPSAVNPRSGAAGPLQFMYGTWLSTPQGRAGYSRFDPYASRQAARWMINRGRLHEWSTWRLCA